MSSTKYYIYIPLIFALNGKVFGYHMVTIPQFDVMCLCLEFVCSPNVQVTFLLVFYFSHIPTPCRATVFAYLLPSAYWNTGAFSMTWNRRL